MRGIVSIFSWITYGFVCGSEDGYVWVNVSEPCLPSNFNVQVSYRLSVCWNDGVLERWCAGRMDVSL